ncbi:MAG: FtsX-like permease family protein [candidate division KSB1 bacterium]|nr:FtsX-like permease family protein [candidate division KSB1 bacterium]MDZ7366849.1 FtsX-like permease family protein [candidate division KSB1 bacterium]MDZ7405144.1 FtsX-like permease family protein [candidate division KSB1 bacterium]
MRRSLIYYWRINLAVVMGAAVATAVLTGALLVGDSVRGSLRDLTLERLGQIDDALVADRFFRQDLAASVAASERFKDRFENAVPAIILTGSAVHAVTKRRASAINLLGIDQRFLDFFDADSWQRWNEFFLRSAEQGFPALAINEALQKELGAEIGDHLLIFVQQQTEIPRETLLGRRDVSDVVKTIRFQLTHIIPNHGLGRFGLRPHQNLPQNAYVALAGLQKALAQPQKANALLVSRQSPALVDSLNLALQEILRENIQLRDLGISMRLQKNFIAVESSEIILDPIIVEAVEAVAAELNAPAQPVLTYLANTIECRGRLLPYSTISATAFPVVKSCGELSLTNGLPVTALANDEILLNEWAAEDLHAKIGDTVKVSYYVVGGREQLVTRSSVFRVAGITAMTGLGADRALTPEFPGIHDAENMHSWNPPFPVDLNLIRPRDEAYWDQYRATPKAFIALQTGQQLWSSRFGNLTSIRLGIDENHGETLRAQLQAGLLAKITPEQIGYVFQPVKEQGLKAAAGATDFSMLFIGFSWFLIVAAALLVGMLFRLGVEQRAKEIGTLLALGYPQRKVRRQMLQEGGILAGIGCLIGLAGAVVYAGILMYGLRTWWLKAIGAPFVVLHVNTTTLGLGYLSAFAVTLLAIVWTLRQLRKVPATALLHGVTTSEHLTPSRFSKIVALLALAGAVSMMILSGFLDESSAAGWFFGSGMCLLIAGLAALSLWFRGRRRQRLRLLGFTRITALAIGYSARNPGRSMSCATLVACACFVIVAVAVNRVDGEQEPLAKDSGTGGFSLIAESDIPLHHNLNTRTGREELGFVESDTALFNRVNVFQMRLLPGEEVSCLNLYQPQQPRVLGVSAEQIARGGFQFRELIDSKFDSNPWPLLDQAIAPEVIPAFGDYNSVRWIMHLGLGKDVVMRNEFGREIKLRFVGLFERSIFQREVLISETNFLKHFPSVSGYSYYLIETSSEQTQAVSQRLEQNLQNYGFDVSSTRAKLADFQAVENTYLSIFQTLGGLGLLLGTFGLGIILIRNAIERRGELATLRAFGFRRAYLVRMLVAENSFLMICGILIGSFSALVAVLPHLLAGYAQTPWLSLASTLALVFVIGLLASLVAVSTILRIPLLPALKAE